jgi:hypothetical protein
MGSVAELPTFRCAPSKVLRRRFSINPEQTAHHRERIACIGQNFFVGQFDLAAKKRFPPWRRRQWHLVLAWQSDQPDELPARSWCMP